MTAVPELPQPPQLPTRRGSGSSGSSGTTSPTARDTAERSTPIRLTEPTSLIARREQSTAFTGTKALYRITETMALLSMSRTVIYEQIRCGRLRTVKQGASRLVPHTAIAEYVALLERESRERAA